MISCEESYPKILDEISNFLKSGEIELVFVTSDEMKAINKSERNKDETTDVLSFPYNKIPNFPLGSVVINLDLAKEMALNLNHSLPDTPESPHLQWATPSG